MKKVVKQSIALICFLSLMIVSGNFLHYLLVDDTNSYTRITLYEMYNSPQNIDIAFVGSSHVYLSLIPDITDDIFKNYTFNAGSSGQEMDTSYAIIREITKNNDVKHIYLEIYFGATPPGKYSNRDSLTQTYIISDYLKPSINKLQLLLHASNSSHYANSFFTIKRNWDKIFDFDYLENLFIKKQSPYYYNHIWPTSDTNSDYYVNRGFVSSKQTLEDRAFWNSAAYTPIDSLSLSSENDWIIYLSKIISYCKQKNIELTLFTAPMPQSTIVGKENYSDYTKFISSYAAENNVEYYDFNLCKEDYFPTNNPSLFRDEDHMNLYGAEIFSDLFARFFTGQIKSLDLFYNSLDEKLADEPFTIYGIAGPYDDGEIHNRIITNRDSGYFYQVSVLPNNGELPGINRIVLDYSQTKEFTLPRNEHGVLTLNCYEESNPEEVYTLCIDY